MPKLIRVHLPEALVALDVDAAPGLGGEPLQDLPKTGRRLAALAPFDPCAAVEQAVEGPGHSGDAAIVGACEEGAGQQHTLRYAPVQVLHDRAPDLVLSVELEAHLGVGQRCLKGFGPSRHGLPVAQHGLIHDGQIDQRHGYGEGIHPGQALQAGHERLVANGQVGKGLVLHGGRIRVDVQLGALQGQLQQVVGQLAIVLDVTLMAPFLDLVQRRLGDVDVPALDQFRHLAKEEGQQQGADVRAVHVGVRHDDDAVVAQLFRLELIAADAAA